jgi:hypothetical protein
MVIPVGSIEPPLSFSPGRWPLSRTYWNWESKGAAVKRPLAVAICSVMKFSPGIRSSTDFPANRELRDNTVFRYRNLLLARALPCAAELGGRDQIGAHDASADHNRSLAAA